MEQQRKGQLQMHTLSQIQAVVFDLDGTLLDTLEDLAEAVNAALSQKNMPLCTIEEIRNFVGNGIEMLMVRAIPGGKDNPEFASTFALFQEYYHIHCKDHTAPYPQILTLMKKLNEHGIKMAIVSNKVDSAVKQLNEEFFGAYTSVAIGEMEGILRKPAPDTVYKALDLMQITKEHAVYVGDSEVDIQTAANVNIPCVSVTWGFRSEEFLRAHGADLLIHQPLELLQLPGFPE